MATTILLSDHIWYRLDITPLAKGWINGQIPNYGLLIRATSDAPVSFDLASNEIPSGALQPRLLQRSLFKELRGYLLRRAPLPFGHQVQRFEIFNVHRKQPLAMQPAS